MVKLFKYFFILVLLHLLIVTFSCLFFPLRSKASDYDEIRQKKILILHSYSSDYDWTKHLNDGVLSVLQQLDWTNTIRVEYMDTKNNSGEEYYEALTELLYRKYSAIRFDCIIATDNNAMNFLGEVHAQLFPQVPVIATGINGVGGIEIPPEITAVVPEQADHQTTLLHALRLRPNAKTCYVIADNSVTGRAISLEVKNTVITMTPQVDFQFVPQMSFEELMYFVSSREPEDFIYLLPYFRDKVGNVFDQGHVATAMATVSPAPVFISWDFQLGTGALGGHVVSGKKLGKIAAHVLLKLLQGEAIAPIISPEEGITESLYDYRSFVHYGLDESSAPEDIHFINRPETFLEQHREVILPGSAVVVVLIIFLILVSANLKKQKLINLHSNKILDLNKEVIETQRELVSTLGEVIETRSQETGNHVKRVAKISRFIGGKAGLSNEELDIIEAASPLHDVGKIGIPDAILHSPEKLTENEYAQIQKHTTIGRDILKSSDRRLMIAACSIAYQHHERWDGTGYPEGLHGEDIHIFARITTLVDVYDALSMDRCYKQAWSEEKVVDYIKSERAGLFDPNLVDLFIKHFEEIRLIRME